jgi:hypothetical protein
MSSAHNATEAADLARDAARLLTEAHNEGTLPGVRVHTAISAVALLAEAEHEVGKALRFAMLTAHRLGADYATLAEVTGVSRQAVRQRLKRYR